MQRALPFDRVQDYLLAEGGFLLACSRLPASQKQEVLCELCASSDRRRAEVALWRVTKAEAGGEIPFFHNR
jgi:hypothetical protein